MKTDYLSIGMVSILYVLCAPIAILLSPFYFLGWVISKFNPKFAERITEESL